MKNFYVLPLVLALVLGCKYFSGSNVGENGDRPPGTPSGRSSELTFSPDKLPAAEVGKPYEVVVKVSGNSTPVGGMSVDEKALPEGLSFDGGGGAGEISGTPKKAGTFKLKISAWCYGTQVSGQSGSMEYELEVKESTGRNSSNSNTRGK